MAGMQGRLFNEMPSTTAPGVDREKASKVAPAIAVSYPEAVSPEYDLGTFQTAIEKSGFVFASLMRLAGVTASVNPLVLKRGTRDLARGRAAEHVRKVLGDVNDESTYPDWIEEKVVRLGLTGENLDEKVRNAVMGPRGRRMVAELHNHNPERMRPLPDQTGKRKTRGYEILVAGKSVFLPWQDAIFTRYVHPKSDYRGLAPVAPMEFDIAGDMAASLHNLKLIRNGVRQGGIFTPQEGYEWTPEHTQQFDAQVQQHNRGPNNAGRYLFIPQAGKFFPEGSSLRDMDYQGLRRLSREIIAGVVGTPPVVIGNFDSASYANSEAQLRAFWEYVGIPLLTKMFGALNEHWVHKELDDQISICADLDQIEAMIEAPGTRSERGAKLFVQGIATQNEARAMAKLPPTPGGDVFAFPVNVIPVAADENPEIIREPTATEEAAAAAAFFENAQTTGQGEEASETFSIKTSLTRDQRAAALALHEKGLQRAERVLGTRVRGSLLAQKQRVLGRFHENVTPEELFPASVEALALLRDVQPALLQIVNAGATDALSRLGIESRGCGIWVAKADAPDAGAEVLARFDLTNDRVEQWLESFANDQLLKISQQTYKGLLREFEISRRAGRGPGELFARLRKMPEFGNVRAAAIARTESIGATNFGTHEGLRSAGVSLKSWLSSRDGARVRHSHQQADIDSHRQPIKISESFTLTDPKRGITQARFPGDTKAAAWARVHCRCAVQPEEEERREYWLRETEN
jgi:HK97 family phage portal protein